MVCIYERRRYIIHIIFPQIKTVNGTVEDVEKWTLISTKRMQFYEVTCYQQKLNQLEVKEKKLHSQILKIKCESTQYPLRVHLQKC